MQEVKTKGLTGYQIKLLGAFLMLLDHIHENFYYAGNLTWMNMLGRCVLPLFLFMCAEGFYYTHSKKQYALRLYLGSFFMIWASSFLEQMFPIKQHEVVLANNVFLTMLTAVIVMYGIQKLKDKQFVKGIIVLLLPILPIFLLQAAFKTDNIILIKLVASIPSYIIIEGGFPMLLLAAWFYLFREKRWVQYLGIIALAVYSIFIYQDFTWAGLFTENYEWMMILAIIPLHFYNGQRGKGSKYFFYIFYPAHIFVLYLLAFTLLKYGLIN